MSDLSKKYLLIALAIPGAALLINDILRFTLQLGQKVGTLIRIGSG